MAIRGSKEWRETQSRVQKEYWTIERRKAQSEKLSGKKQSKETVEKRANKLRGRQLKKRVERVCEECGGTFLAYPNPSDSKRRWCSRTCYNKSETQKKERTEGQVKYWDQKGRKAIRTRSDLQGSRYDKWRKSVFERDKYTCQRCGKSNCILNAHHIKPWAKFSGLRYVLENGITLCVECHKQVHKEMKVNAQEKV